MASATTVGILRVLLTASSAEFEAAMKQASSSAKAWTKDLQGIGKQATAIGSSMTMALTLPLVGLGAAFVKVGKDFDDASDSIRASTGATGKDLDALNASFKGILSVVPASMRDAATAIGDLSTRTDLTGAALEGMAAQLLNLSRVSKAEIGPLIAATTRAFGDWSIVTDQQSGALDFLFRTTQNTGIGITRLTELVVQFGAPMRALGFSFEETAALMGKWEQEGVNLETVMSGLRFALGNFAKAGKEPEQALRDVQAAILGAKTESEATGIAFQVFGKRAAVDMGRAILEGRFQIDDLVASLKNSKETINGAAADTLSLGEKMTLLGNRVSVAAAPIGAMLVKALESLMGIAEPVIHAIGLLSQGFSVLPAPVQGAFLAFGLAVAAAGPLIWTFGQLAISASAVTAAFTAQGIGTRALTALMPGYTTVVTAAGTASAKTATLVGGLSVAFKGLGIIAVAGLAIQSVVDILSELNARFTKTQAYAQALAKESRGMADALIVEAQAYRAVLVARAADMSQKGNAIGAAQLLEKLDRDIAKAKLDLAVASSTAAAAEVAHTAAVADGVVVAKTASGKAVELRNAVALLSDVTKADILERKAQGATVKDLSKEFGVGKDVITAFLKEQQSNTREAKESAKAAKEATRDWDAWFGTIRDNQDEIVTLSNHLGRSTDLLLAFNKASGAWTLPKAMLDLLPPATAAVDVIANITRGMDVLSIASDGAGISAGLVTNAYRTLGMKTPAELQKIADAAILAFNTLKNSGTTSAVDLQTAYEKMTDAVNAATGKIPSFWESTVGPQLKAAFHGIGAEFSDVLARMITAQTGWKDGFLGIWHSIKDAINNIFSQILNAFINRFLKGMLGAISGQQGSFSSAFSGMFSGGSGSSGLGSSLMGLFGGGGGATGGIGIGGATGGAGMLTSRPISGMMSMPGGGGAAGGMSAGMSALGGVGGGVVGWQIGSALTERYGKAKGALGGMASGAAMGAMMGGPIGAAVGGVIGLVGGLIAKSAESKFVNKPRDEYLQSFETGGARAKEGTGTTPTGAGSSLAGQLTVAGAGAGGGALMKAIFDAKDPKAFDAAVKNAEAALAKFQATQDKAAASSQLAADAAGRYGLSIEDMGDAFQQAAIGKLGDALLADMTALEKAGVDQGTILKGMAGSFQELYDTAQLTGEAIPSALQPTIDTLLEMGLILDTAGVKAKAFSAAQIEAMATLKATLAPDEAKALATGFSQAVAEGFKGSQDEFLKQQLEFYGTLEEGDKRLKTFFYGNTIDAFKLIENGATETYTRIAGLMQDLATEQAALSKSIENEAPEEVMGSIESLTRDRLAAIALETTKLADEMHTAAEASSTEIETSVTDATDASQTAFGDLRNKGIAPTEGAFVLAGDRAVEMGDSVIDAVQRSIPWLEDMKRLIDGVAEGFSPGGLRGVSERAVEAGAALVKMATEGGRSLDGLVRGTQSLADGLTKALGFVLGPGDYAEFAREGLTTVDAIIAFMRKRRESRGDYSPIDVRDLPHGPGDSPLSTIDPSHSSGGGSGDTYEINITVGEGAPTDPRKAKEMGYVMADTFIGIIGRDEGGRRGKLRTVLHLQPQS